MLKRLGRSITYANVMATVAFFLALTGGAYAVTLSKNSVASRHIKNGQVKNADLAGGAVASAKVKDGSLLGKDLKPGTLARAWRIDGAAGDTEFASGSTQVLAKLENLPAGHYVFTANANLKSNQFASAADCWLDGGGDGSGDVRDHLSVVGEFHSVAPSGAWTLASPASVVLNCKVFSSKWSAEDVSLVAVRVSALDARRMFSTGP